MSNATDHIIITATQQWLEKAVIGLNLCPFARTVHVQQRIAYVVSHAHNEEGLLHDLCTQLYALHDADATHCETVLLIHPYVMNDFLDYNDFLEIADAAVAECGLEGELQVASFHPHYQFAGTQPDDIENCTNRAPYPTLHLLREASVEAAVAAYPNTDAIFENNMQTLRGLGWAGWRVLFANIAATPQK